MQSDEQESLFRRWQSDHIGLMLKIVRGYATSKADQDELLQDVLSNLWISIPRFRGSAKESTWIYRVALNTSLAWRRGEHRRRRLHQRFWQDEGPSRSALSSNTNDAHQERIDNLYVAIRRLSKVDTALALMHLDGVSYQEMADVLGISENYVGVKLNRIRKELFESLKDDRDEL